MNDPKKWIKDVLNAPDGIRLYERERVLIDATEAICDAMQRQGVNRKELADRLEVTQANVTQILSGNRNLTLGLLSDVFVALGRSLKIEHEPLAVSALVTPPVRLIYEAPTANDWSSPALPAPVKCADKDGLAA